MCADTPGCAFSGYAIKGAAIGRVAASGIFLLVILQDRMMVQDHSGKFLHHFRLVRLVAGQLEHGGTARRDLHPVKAALQAFQFLGHTLVHIEVGKGQKAAASSHKFVLIAHG